MASNKKWLYAALGIILGLFLITGNYWIFGVIVLVLAIPAAAWLALDPSQRRRYREIRRRRSLGR